MKAITVSSCLCLSAAIALANTTFVQAQALEEVIVTAQKRSQDLQDVPVAVTALSEEFIKQTGIDDMKGIALRTPGFSMGNFTASQPQLFIRGIGSNGDGAANGESSVAVFLDGVYINRSAGAATEIFDLASIEVLRGPQGTLWGKNAIGGAINLSSKKPADEFTVNLELGVGNLSQRSYRGLISGPLSDDLSAKVTFSKKDRDPYMESVVDPSVKTMDVNSDSVRAQLHYAPESNFEAMLTLDYATDKRTGVGTRPSREYGLIGQTLAAMPEVGFHQNHLEDPGFQDSDTKGISLKVDWDLEIGTLTSITAYREGNAGFDNYLLGVGPQSFGYLTLNNFMDENTEMLSQELRIAGDSDNLKWQAGIYLNNEKTHRLEGGEFFSTVLPAAALVTASADQRNETSSVALFTQGTYSITEDLDLTLGLRYTREEKDFSNIGTPGTAYVSEPYNVAETETWSAVTPKLIVNYHLNDSSMLYFSAATGFKSGGFDGVVATEIAAKTPFDEEEALNLEIGLKSMLLDDRVRLNAALFNVDYENLQVLQTFDCGGCSVPPLVTKNAGEAESRGLELELTLAATDNLQLSATYAYLDTEYKKLDGNLAQYEGNNLRNAPKNAFSLAAVYEKDLAMGGAINGRIEYISKDKAYQDIENFEYSAIPSYELTNMRLAYMSEDEQWEIAAWVNNALDEEYYIHNYQIAPFGAFPLPGLPRTYGLTVSWSNL